MSISVNVSLGKNIICYTFRIICEQSYSETCLDFVVYARRMFHRERTILPIFVKLVKNSSGGMLRHGTNWFASLVPSIAMLRTVDVAVENAVFKNV